MEHKIVERVDFPEDEYINLLNLEIMRCLEEFIL